VSEWVDILTPSLAVVALVLAIGLAVQAWRHGRAIRRLEDRLAQVGAAAEEGPLQRLAELGQRMRREQTGGGGARRLARPAAITAVTLVAVAVLAGGAWALVLRDDGGGTGTAATTAGTTEGRTGTTTTAAAPDPGRCGTVRPLPDNGAVTVTIFNASGVDGAAKDRIAPDINLEGYRLGLVDNPPDDRADLRRSQVQFVRPADRGAACNVAKVLGLNRVAAVEGYTPDQIGGSEVNVVVVVGRDLARS
jgi:hypothetical protein